MTGIDVSILISLLFLLQIETEVGNPYFLLFIYNRLYTGWMNCDNNDNENNNDHNKLLFTRGNQQ